MKSPIVAFLGHVDAGKTSIMDAIRDTYFAYRESGGLTQNIGITEVPTERIQELCKDLLVKFNVKILSPSIIFIDSPGHEAFTTLRKRGASIADLVVLVIDSTVGIQQQTVESIEILKSYKTPFLIAFTKIDRLSGFIHKENISFLDFLSTQNESFKSSLDEAIYSLSSDLLNYGFSSERFDRVRDFTKEVAIIPVSSVNRIGINDLIVMIIGLSQKYLSLEDSEESGRAALMEIKEVKGVGKIYDAIVYSGVLKVGDKVVIMTQDGAGTTKVKGIMKLMPLEESRENFGKYEYVESVKATSPIRLILQSSDAVIGTTASVYRSEEEKEKIMKEIEEYIPEESNENRKGVIVCADSVGSLDAIRKIAQDKNMEIGFTKIGSPVKRVIMIAKTNQQPVLCFNVSVDQEVEELAKENGVQIISKRSIYELFDAYDEFRNRKEQEKSEMIKASLTLPVKFRVLSDSIFRRSDPFIAGVEILAGELRPNYYIIDENAKRIGKVLGIQSEKKALASIRTGEKAAVSIEGAVFGRNMRANQILYSDMSNEDMIKFIDISSTLPEDYQEAFQEIRKIKGF